MKIRIEKGVASGEIFAPGSKSDAHRLLICAALADGESLIEGITPCADVQATVGALRALGAEIEICEDKYTVRGTGGKPRASASIDAWESGSTLRFLIPVAAISGEPTSFTGRGRLMQRPLEPYEKLFGEHSLTYIKNEADITVKGPLKAGNYAIRGDVSSQFISGLLFALPLLDGESRITVIPPFESRSYVLMTIRTLEKFGVHTELKDDGTIIIPGGQSYTARKTRAEGDYSAAAFTDALNLLGGKVNVLGLDGDSLQADRVYRSIFPRLRDMHADVSIEDCPDLGPILFALAAAKHGAHFEGTRRLRIKESDRVCAMLNELAKLGVSAVANDNTVDVYKAALHAPETAIDGHNDHRIVMAMAILLTTVGGEINGAEAVSKSYPSFFDDLKRLGIKLYEQTD